MRIEKGAAVEMKAWETSTKENRERSKEKKQKEWIRVILQNTMIRTGGKWVYGNVINAFRVC